MLLSTGKQSRRRSRIRCRVHGEAMFCSLGAGRQLGMSTGYDISARRLRQAPRPTSITPRLRKAEYLPRSTFENGDGNMTKAYEKLTDRVSMGVSYWYIYI